MRYIILISAVMLCLLSSCTGPDRNMLKKADAIMEQHPDSAFHILQSIDRSTLSKRDLPYYALLMTQAQVKTDVPVASDSLISIAYSKYGDDWRGDRGIRSCFYMGETFFNQDKPKEAMRHYLCAYEEAKRLGDDYWHAKAAERIADLFYNTYNYTDAVRYRKEAIEGFGKSGRITNQRYAIADLATEYINDSRDNEALCMLDSVYRIASIENPADSFLLVYIRRPRIDALVNSDRISELDSTDYRLLDKNFGDAYCVEATILKSQLSSNKKEPSILNMLDSISLLGSSDEDQVQILYAKYELAKGAGDPTLALALVDSLLYYYNSVTDKIIKESVKSSESDFFADLYSKNKRKADMYFICFLAACFAAFLIWRIYRIKYKAKRAQLEAGIEEFIELKAYSDRIAKEKSNLIEGLSMTLIEKTTHIDLLQKQIDTQSNDLRSKEAILETLFREKWATLNMLCNEYYEKGDSPIMRRHIIDSLEKELKKIASKKGLAQIEAAVDERFDGIIGQLKNQCPFLSEKDINMAILIIAGFSGKAISYLMAIKTGNYYVSKRRLIDRIAASDAPDKERFISRLH